MFVTAESYYFFSKSLMNIRTKNTRHSSECFVFFFFKEGLEGRAAQSNSPVDCCDRERPSARRRASQVPPLRPKDDNPNPLFKAGDAFGFFISYSLLE